MDKNKKIILATTAIVVAIGVTFSINHIRNTVKIESIGRVPIEREAGIQKIKLEYLGFKEIEDGELIFKNGDQEYMCYSSNGYLYLERSFESNGRVFFNGIFKKDNVEIKGEFYDENTGETVFSDDYISSKYDGYLYEYSFKSEVSEPKIVFDEDLIKVEGEDVVLDLTFLIPLGGE